MDGRGRRGNRGGVQSRRELVKKKGGGGGGWGGGDETIGDGGQDRKGRGVGMRDEGPRTGLEKDKKNKQTQRKKKKRKKEKGGRGGWGVFDSGGRRSKGGGIDEGMRL